MEKTTDSERKHARHLAATWKEKGLVSVIKI